MTAPVADLAQRVVLVTGAARGLGRAIATRCAQAGATVVLADMRADEVRAAGAALLAAGHRASAHACDITRRDDLDALARAIEAEHGRLDVLVNNAALATGLAGRRFEAIDEAAWDRVFEINVKGTWRVTSALLPLLRRSSAGRIVNLASDTALWGGDLFLHYVASKGAIVAMTRGMARELGGENITVNAIAPGLTPTEGTSSAPERRWQQYLDGQLIKRRIEAADVAETVAFLASAGAGMITGQVIAVNGGMTFG